MKDYTNSVARVQVVHTDGRETIFKNITVCAQELGISSKLVKKFIDSKEPFASKSYPQYTGVMFYRLAGIDHVDGFVELVFSNVKDMYLINSEGHILSKYNNSLRIPNSDRDGYLRVFLQTTNGSSTSQRIATLVAYTFIGPPPDDMDDPTVDHIDCDKENNHYTNLRWMSRGDNSKRAHVGISIGANNHFYGKTHTDDAKAAMRERNLGKTYSPEVNAKKASPKPSVAVYTEGNVLEFSSAKELAEYLGTTYGTCVRYLRGEKGRTTHFYRLENCYLYYKTDLTDEVFTSVLDRIARKLDESEGNTNEEA